MKELSLEQTKKVDGGIWANVAGAALGAYGGFYGAVISNSNANGWDMLAGALGGAAAGALSPVRGIRSGAIAIGSGLIGGAVTNVVKDIEIVVDGR